MRPDATSKSNARRDRYADRALDAWSEIADFTGRSVRTVQRWEEFYHFPVHRDRGGVRAFPAEIDEWMSKPLTFRTNLDLEANSRWNQDVRNDAREALERSRALREEAQNQRARAQQLRKRK